VKRIRPTTPGVIAAAVAAVALALGAAQAGEAATAPSAGWHTYDPSVAAGGSLSGIYAVSASDAWAVSESPSGGQVFHFTGTAWATVGGPDLGALQAVGGTSDSDLWVLGTTKSAHYNGSSWTTYPLVVPAGATDGDYNDLVYDAGTGNVYAAVAYAVTVKGDLVDEQSLEHFNGQAWSTVAKVPNISADGSIISNLTGAGPDDIYLSAVYDNTTKSELLHFNGSAWSAVKLPGTPYDPQVNVTGTGQALALATTISGPNTVGYAAKLSGGTWTTVSLPLSNRLPLDSARGSGKAWTTLLDYSDANAPETLWQWSAGHWTQIKATSAEASGTLYGAADGSGVWSLNGSDADLYVG
jgi:hypothetical protein